MANAPLGSLFFFNHNFRRKLFMESYAPSLVTFFLHQPTRIHSSQRLNHKILLCIINKKAKNSGFLFLLFPYWTTPRYHKNTFPLQWPTFAIYCSSCQGSLKNVCKADVTPYFSFWLQIKIGLSHNTYLHCSRLLAWSWDPQKVIQKVICVVNLVLTGEINIEKQLKNR